MAGFGRGTRNLFEMLWIDVLTFGLFAGLSILLMFAFMTFSNDEFSFSKLFGTTVAALSFPQPECFHSPAFFNSSLEVKCSDSRLNITEVI